jgi:hypothetical protein
MDDGRTESTKAWPVEHAQSGRWQEAQPVDDKPGNPTAIGASRQMANIGVDLPGGLPYQPWLIPIVKERTENEAIDDSPYQLPAGQLPSRVRTAASAEVRPLARPAGRTQ